MGGAFISVSQYDWLKGSNMTRNMTKVVWLWNETDYSYCEFVAPNNPYWKFYECFGSGIFEIQISLRNVIQHHCMCMIFPKTCLVNDIEIINQFVC